MAIRYKLSTVLLLLALLTTIGVLAAVGIKKMKYGQEETYAEGASRIGCGYHEPDLFNQQTWMTFGDPKRAPDIFRSCVDSCIRTGERLKPGRCTCRDCKQLCSTEWSDFKERYKKYGTGGDLYGTGAWHDAKKTVIHFCE
jgi:hypothetical protein